MSKVGIICEGGGTKGAYTTGVLECFMDQGIKVPYCAGISAGAMALMPYVSGQKERLRITGVEATTQKGAIGLVPIMKEGSIFGIESTYNFLEERCPLDFEAYKNSDIELEMGLYNIETGKLEYFNKEMYTEDGSVVKAACALLLLAKPVMINGTRYMDAGLIDMIPVEPALKAGCDKIIFISTKEENYERKPAPNYQISLAKMVYKNEPYIAEDLKVRHLNYKKQWGMVKDLEAKGKAIILRPSMDMGISRYTTDKDKLNKWYDLGYQDTLAKIEEIRKWIEE